MARLRGKAAIGKLSDVSPLNFDMKAMGNPKLPRKIRLGDMTLREGRQLEGVVLTQQACLKVARVLDDLGCQTIQIPYGGHYPRELELMKELNKLKLKARIEVLTFDQQNPPYYSEDALFETMAKIVDLGATPYVCLALGDRLLRGFGEFRKLKFKNLRDLQKQEIDLGVRCTQFVKKRGGMICSNVQDPMRCDLDYMDDFCKAMVDAGMDYLIFDDIASPAVPSIYKYIVERAYKAAPKGTFGFYPHDDYGFGMGSACGCIEGGAEIIQCTINGFGKRGGMMNLGQMAVICEFMYGLDTGLKLEQLYDVGRLIADIYRQPLPWRVPVTGATAYTHGADWHVQFAFNPDYPNPEYPWVVNSIKPELVGQKSRLSIYTISGEMGMRVRAAELGIKLTVPQALKVWAALREEMEWRSRPIENDEFLAVVKKAVPAAIK